MAVRKPPCSAGLALTWAKTSAKERVWKCCDDEEHREQEAEVADAVDDEGFLAGVGGGFFTEVEADEQVGGETDAFPADEEQQEVRREHQHGHEEHEEVEVGEEAPEAVLMGHVADRVNVDEEADAGDDGEHDHGEVVDGEGEVDLKAGDLEPGAEGFGDGERGAGAAHGEPEVGDDAARDAR